MPDGANGESVKVTLDGSHVRVDARPARLVSLLKSANGGSTITAQPASGDAHTEPLPTAARQATFRVRDDVTVEATPAADFVAIAEDDGGYLVVAFSGEITVIPGGGDRFALGAHEALVVPGGRGGEPRIVAASELAADNAEIAGMLDATAAAVLTPTAPVETTPATDETPAADEPTPVAAAAAAAGAAGATGAGSAGVAGNAAKAGGAAKAGATKAGGAKATPAKAASKSAGGGGRRKKGKKGRPQPVKSATKKTAGAAAGAAAAAGAVGASKAAPKTGGPSAPPPKQPPKGGGGGGGGGKGGGGGSDDDDSYEDTPRDKRFLVGAVMFALLLAVGAIFILSDTDDPGTDVASDRTTTTTDATETTATPGETTTAPATSTTVAPTTAAPTTTARATTTTARATTTTAAPKADYAIAPKSCVQNGNSITYAASVTNKADGPFDFKVNVSFKTADGTEVAKATATVTDLASGKTADFSATGTSSRNLAGTGAGCHVTGVDATPSG